MIVILLNQAIHPVMLIQIMTDFFETYYAYSNEMVSQNQIGQEFYKLMIKPKALIFEIFKNIFEGNYIQFNIIKETKPEALQRLFKVTTNLIFSIKLEDIIGHISKLNSIYYVIKVIFCYHIDIASLENDSDFDKIIQLVSEGIDSLDNCCIILSHSLVNKNNLDLRLGSEILHNSNNPKHLHQI
jgi:hypothetical protein